MVPRQIQQVEDSLKTCSGGGRIWYAAEGSLWVWDESLADPILVHAELGDAKIFNTEG